MASSSNWTPDEDAILICLKQQGYNYEYIGEKLGRTAMACRGRLERFSNPDYYKRNNRRARAEGEEYQWNSASKFLSTKQKEKHT